MKKYILIAILLVSTILVYGQRTDDAGSVQTGASTFVLATDTATNTGDVWIGLGYTSSGYRGFTKGYKLAIQPVATQLTGTTAGNIILQASIDGTNFVTLNSGNSDLLAANDTLVAVDAASTLWVTTVAYPIYRVFYDASGTHTSTLGATYYLIKPEN